MRRLLALAPVAALAALGAALALLSPAAAGGPTSVLVTEPATGRATALYYSDARYTELDELLTTGTLLGGEPAALGRRTVNLTWMIHDAEPWRSQTLYPEAEGGPVVASYDRTVDGRSARPEWRRLAEDRAVDAALARAFRGRATPAPAAPAPDVAPPAAPAVTERVVTRTETAWWSLRGWRWLIPGLAVGAGATGLLARRRPQPAEETEGLPASA